MASMAEQTERQKTGEGVQGWLLQNGFNLVFALLISVIGWITNQTLSDIREDIKQLNVASQAMALQQNSHASRIEFLEKLVAVQAQRQQEYDKANLEFWKEYGPVLERMKNRR